MTLQSQNLNINIQYYSLCTLHFFLAHLAQAIVSYCHTNASVPLPTTLENKYSDIFNKTTRPTVLNFHIEHDLTPGSENCKIGSGLISKMAADTKSSKNNKINFFSRALSCFTLTDINSSGRNRLNFHDRSLEGVSDQWSIIHCKSTKWTYAGDVDMLATSPDFEYISTWYVHVYYVTLTYIIILIKNRKIVADS